jgi:hypothetical protein
VKRQSHSRADLETENRGEQKARPIYGTGELSDRQQRRQYHGRSMEWGDRVIVVELEALEEGAVE